MIRNEDKHSTTREEPVWVCVACGAKKYVRSRRMDCPVCGGTSFTSGSGKLVETKQTRGGRTICK
jgi:hypothetical protein